MDCFGKQAALLIPLTQERKVEITDQTAMRQLGMDIGKNLLNQNCESFLKLSMALVKSDSSDDAELSSASTGVLKRIDTKDFNYFILTGSDNKEKSFIWLRQFPGSEKYISNPKAFIGKSVTIDWKEIEVFIPAAKSYFKLKEVTGITVK
ncbi:hypothetical protein [Pedobacter sp. SYSU D00535]|uniref:hypothetical protein n=1 Tax=Pedobacter sp. SYSU D00535 TaxID=2810308 RepID=UPI001A973DDB|nr:hypothetical protein [Pedobacter sp. SYSU D00535]